MPDPVENPMQREQERINHILMKVVAYQHTLCEDRPVEIDELICEGVLEPSDIEFLASNSVTYKPHRRSDYHAIDMFHMPTSGGGCVFIGPGSPPLKKHRVPLQNFQAVVENFLQLPRPRDELLLHVEFTSNDGLAVAPELICFSFGSPDWQERLPAIRGVAAEFGFRPLQNEALHGIHLLTLAASADSVQTATATLALLRRGCGFADQAEIIYSAGALDER